MVSIPTLFNDGACRPFTLLGVEMNGLWLQSDELTGRLLPGDKEGLASTSRAVFVPFAQIAGVLAGAESPTQPAKQGTPTPAPSAASAPTLPGPDAGAPPPDAAPVKDNTNTKARTLRTKTS